MTPQKETAAMPGGMVGGSANGSQPQSSAPILSVDTQLQFLRDRVAGLSTNGTQAIQLTGLRRYLLEHLDAGGDVASWVDNDPTRQELVTSLFGVEPGAAPTRHWPLLSITDLRTRPKADVLVGEAGGKIILPAGITMLYGGPKCGKSFLGLDWALCVASGIEWQGHPVKAGPVVYVFGEGDEDLLDRLDAWAEYHEYPNLSNFYLVDAIDTPLHMWNREGSMMEPSAFADELIESIPSKTPSLVVFDTLARMTVGANENASQDMGIVMQALAIIKKRTGANILLIHHATKQTRDNGRGVYRGSTAIHGAVNALYELTKSGKDLTLRGDSAKGFEPPAETALELDPFGPSMVVIGGVQRPGALHSHCIALLQIADERMPEGVGRTAWMKTFMAESNMSERTFHKAKRDLLDGGYIRPREVNEDGTAKQRTTWLITESGRECLTASERSEAPKTTASKQAQPGRILATTAIETTALEDDYEPQA